MTATRGDEDPEWSVVSGELYHQLYAGSNLLMGEFVDVILRPCLSNRC